MTSRDFAYWLQGFLEINSAGGTVVEITSEQTKTIQKHLNMVFIHEIDPSMGGSEKQEALNNAHNSPTLWPHTEENTPKPPEADNTWELSTLYGWYDPKYGKPRC